MFQQLGQNMFTDAKAYLMQRNATSNILIFHIRDEHYHSTS